MDEKVREEGYFMEGGDVQDKILAERDARISELNDKIHRLMQEISELHNANVRGEGWEGERDINRENEVERGWEREKAREGGIVGNEWVNEMNL